MNYEVLDELYAENDFLGNFDPYSTDIDYADFFGFLMQGLVTFIFHSITSPLGLMIVGFVLVYQLLRVIASAIPFVKKVRAKPEPPRVAYKKAVLVQPSSQKPFRGVTGTPYGPDDNAVGPGFHAYNSFERASNHPQEGNVILEVLLSGNVEVHTRGYVADHQRVLQVIPDRCNGHPEWWEYCIEPVKNFYFPKGSIEVAFSCEEHTPKRAMKRKFLRKSRIEEKPNRYFPLKMLPELMPWMKEHGIVVATKEGSNKFVATKPLSDSQTLESVETEQ